jgi:hypothetical protein
VNYNLGSDDREGTCNVAGVDLTNVAERELKLKLRCVAVDR